MSSQREHTSAANERFDHWPSEIRRTIRTILYVASVDFVRPRVIQIGQYTCRPTCRHIN